MEPDDQTWQIIANNDDCLDGQRWYAVKSTMIFCKPSCPSRLPDRQNVIMYADPEQAMAAGFRP
ncbi:putative ADA regulatory protein [Secundilactobacillus oryzae JCM 18671]|uniref:Putative ADA regulatory protein n=1 Tax=Secundilactobacillus oryzae JCM 18671 TaxID=1291743 RepID=A0A081BL30_9LACO|nr:Ada metal-binding domain-containing protein [Secundilactobacillus oryzae]GAK48748.1 putative ADA regulatory protein [Secundilactobacillus oryzae JCM 18671]